MELFVWEAALDCLVNGRIIGKEIAKEKSWC